MLPRRREPSERRECQLNADRPNHLPGLAPETGFKSE
jgi:hypothetical protein